MTVENPGSVVIPDNWQTLDGNDLRSLAADLSDSPIKNKADAFAAIVKEVNRRDAEQSQPAAEQDPVAPPVEPEVPAEEVPEEVPEEVSKEARDEPAPEISKLTLLEQEAGRQALQRRRNHT